MMHNIMHNDSTGINNSTAKRICMLHIQWNLYNADTIGAI